MEFDEVLEKARDDEITREEALYLFENTKRYDKALELFKIASKVRDDETGAIYKLDGCLGPITPCTLDPLCKYCFAANPKTAWSTESVLTLDEIPLGAKMIEETGTISVHLGGGSRLDAEGVEVIEAVKAVKKATNLRIRVNVGPGLSEDTLKELKKLGVKEVGSLLETTNEKLFGEVKPGDSFEVRKKLARMIDEVGLGLVGGFMAGMSELSDDMEVRKVQYEDYVNHMFYVKQFANLRCFAVYGFTPRPGTPLEDLLPTSPLEIARATAIARLIFRDVDIDMCSGEIPLRVLSGANRAFLDGASVHKRSSTWGRPMAGARVKEIGSIELVDLLPVTTTFIRDAGMDVEPGIAEKYRGE